MERRRVTLEDIARRAGVSRATVSFALRNDPRLRPATRTRIKKLADRMGYTPDPVVSRLLSHLRASRTARYKATLALVNCSPRHQVFEEVRTYDEWRRGARARAEQMGYRLDEFWLHDPGVSAGRLCKVMDSRGIEGVLAAPLFNEGVLPPEFDVLWNRFACVVIGKMSVSPPFHGSRNDQFNTAMTAVLQAEALGYRRPALVLSSAVDRNVGWRFSAGYRAGLALAPSLRHAGTFDFDWSGDSRFRRWLKGRETDVLIGIHAEIRKWVAEMRIAVPQKLGLIHLDKNSELRDWAGMNQNQPRVGGAAVDLLISRIHMNRQGPASDPFCAVIPGAWEPGATVRAPGALRRRLTVKQRSG